MGMQAEVSTHEHIYTCKGLSLKVLYKIMDINIHAEPGTLLKTFDKRVEESKDGELNSYEVKSNRVERSKFQEEVAFESHEENHPQRDGEMVSQNRCSRIRK